jgi:hypothetical protein
MPRSPANTAIARNSNREFLNLPSRLSKVKRCNIPPDRLARRQISDGVPRRCRRRGRARGWGAPATRHRLGSIRGDNGRRR